MIRSEEELGIRDFNVAIGAAITSYARLYITGAIEDFKAHGAEVYYTDTDSLKTNLPMGKYPDLLNKYFWDNEGKELGTLKNECEEEIKAHVKHWVKQNLRPEIQEQSIKDILEAELAAEPHGEYSFDSLVVCGCKNYALRRKFLVYDLPPLEMFTLKGLRKNAKISAYARSDAPVMDHDREHCPIGTHTGDCELCARMDCPSHDPHHYQAYPFDDCPSCTGERDLEEVEVNVNNFNLMSTTNWIDYPNGGVPLSFEHYEILASGGLIKQDQEQFRSGAAALLSEGQRGGSRIIKLPKQVRSGYNKGIVQADGSVRPLRLTSVDYARQDKHTPHRYMGLTINPADEPDAPVKRSQRNDESDEESDGEDEEEEERRPKRRRLAEVGGIDSFFDTAAVDDDDSE